MATDLPLPAGWGRLEVAQHHAREALEVWEASTRKQREAEIGLAAALRTLLDEVDADRQVRAAPR